MLESSDYPMNVSRLVARPWAARLSFAWCLLSFSCGSTDDKTLVQGDGVPVPSAGGASATGGATGAGGAAPGAGGTAEPICSLPTQCSVPSGARPCCTDDFRCGISVGEALPRPCVTPDPGLGLDQNCPTRFILEGTGHGCCRSNHTCGYQDPKYGLGCLDPTQLDLPAGAPCGS
jgi:hypothetical protein